VPSKPQKEECNKQKQRVKSASGKKTFGALPEDDVPYVKTCRVEVKE
jgi:hypothetical protein